MFQISLLDRRIILALAAANAIAILLGVVAFLIGGRVLAPTLLCLASLTILATFISITILFFHYRNTFQYKKKHSLLVELRRLNQAIEKNDRQIAQTQAIRRAIRQEETAATEKRQAEHKEALDRIHKRRALAHNEEIQEYAIALRQIQNAYLDNGLRAASIQDSRILGIGPKYKDRLIANGVACALNVQASRIAAIQGFGEAKVNAIVNWRRSVESTLRENMPRRLPEAQVEKIKLSYENLRQQLEQAEKQAHQSLESDLAVYSQQAAERDAKNDALEAGARQCLRGLGRARKGLEKSLASYHEVSYFNYLAACVGISGSQNRLTNVLTVGGLLTILGLCPLLQASLGVSSTAALIIASIPTSTLTPTFTLTHTPTITPLPSLTATITLTPSSTHTPTVTLTPTISPTPTITPTPSPTLPSSIHSCIPRGTLRQMGKVVKIIDGDTIDVQLENKKVYRIRYIGIDTPEKGDPGYKEATRANRQLVNGKVVTLVMDVSETDRYDRLLRYVIVEDIFVNHSLVVSGYAMASTYPPDVACSEEFVKAQALARQNESGLWAPKPTPRPTLPPESDRINCDPAYPDVCIDPWPPDLDCKDVPYRRFRVLPPDPHNFDGDGDGVGCESG